MTPPRYRQPTIIDVATAAGVSRTQASDALNGRGRVDASTRERVAAAAQRLGYRANLSARNLRSGKTGVLALLLPALGGVSGESEAWGVETYVRNTVASSSAAFAHGYAVTLVPPVDALTWLAQIPYDGAIISDPDYDDERLGVLERLGIPFVTLERDLARSDGFYVASGTVNSTRLLLDHLASAGAGRIALLRPEAEWAWIVETASTFEAWCAERGREPLVVPVPLHHLEGSSYESCLVLLAGPDRPDAVLALADGYALGALRAATELGISVPAELLIGAGVDSQTNAAVQPSITALDIDPDGSARAAVEMLVRRLAGDPVERAVTIPGRLVIRASTTPTSAARSYGR